MGNQVAAARTEWEEAVMPHRAVCLSELNPGDEGAITRVDAKGSIRRRLLEMGFTRGERLRVVKLAPLGDPMEIILKGYHLSLRREESICILVDRDDG